MKYLELKIPPLLLTVVFAAIMWLSNGIAIEISLSNNVRILMAMVFITLAVIVTLAGVIAFRQANTTVDPTKPESSSSLVNSGIYKYTRNPMYVGFSCFLMAICFYLANPILIGYVVIFVLYLNKFQIEPEETILRGIFGQEYIDYCERVNRWI